MDLTETYAPSQSVGSAGEEKTTDYFDFVVSPPPPATHYSSTDGTVDEDSFLHRTGCRTTIGFLDARLHHDGFIKEANNNTLTALPPVSTITGSLGHIGHHNSRNRCLNDAASDGLAMDQSAEPDCGFWVPDPGSKEQTCSIMLEDLNKYCWTAQASGEPHAGLLIQRRDSPLADAGLQVHHRDAGCDDRQNTDGSIYTLTVLNSEANSMDGLDCCKSPSSGAADGWGLRQSNHLDLDAILNMENSVSIADEATGNPGAEHEHERQVVVTTNGAGVERYAVTAQYAPGTPADEQAAGQFVSAVGKAEPGDNNNDWKLSDRNSLEAAAGVAGGVTQQQVAESAESLLRNALQGKLYSTTAARILSSDAQPGGQQQAQAQDEAMQGCADEILLSHLDVNGAYTTELKHISNETIDTYCNLEPVCNVQATTVMYTLDPTSGSLGTITLPADLANVGTVTVVTTAPPQQDVLHQDTSPQSTNNHPTTTTGQLQLTTPTSGTGRGSGTKTKKYSRRQNRNAANGTAGAAGASAGSSTTSAAGNGTAGSPGSVQQRKERSLHYCSICSKGFKDKYSVNVHIRTHTGEKPFACGLCGKSFRQKAHLAKHYQTHVTQKSNVAAASAAAQAATTANSSNTTVTVTTTSSNSSNGPTSNANSNASSVRSAPSPVANDMQQIPIPIAVVEQLQQIEQQQQQQIEQMEQQPLEEQQQQFDQQQQIEPMELEQQALDQQVVLPVVVNDSSPIVTEVCNPSS